MALPTFGGFTIDWTTKATKISGQATTFKGWMNSRTAELLTFVQSIETALASIADGSSGADNVGMTAITETGANATVQSVIEALITKLKAVADSASGADLIGMTAITETGANATVQSVIEALITRLKAVADSSSGADLVGMTAITETGANATVQSVIEALITRLKAVTDSSSGADLIGATAITQTGAAATVQAILEALAPMTTQGDITYQGASAPARLAKGTAGQVLTMNSGATAPEWADAAGGASTWTTVDSFTRASDSSYTVTDNAANQAIHCKGRPIRYADTLGTYSYGIITGYTTGTVTLAGAPMTTSFDAILEYGDMTRVVQVDVMIPSTFAKAGASSTLINSYLKANLLWRYGAAYLVRFGVIVDVDDSGASQTIVNVNVAGSAISTSNTNAGLTIAETWTYTTTDINTTNYSIAQDEEIELINDATGSNDDATDLTVSMTFVLA